MEHTYTIYAALGKEDKEGWVWLKEPRVRAFTPIKIHNPQTGRSVCCEARHIDANFLREYNQQPRIEIRDAVKALVISDWYREALGGFDTTHQSGQDIHLRVRKLACWGGNRCAALVTIRMQSPALELGWAWLGSGLESLV